MKSTASATAEGPINDHRLLVDASTSEVIDAIKNMRVGASVFATWLNVDTGDDDDRVRPHHTVYREANVT